MATQGGITHSLAKYNALKQLTCKLCAVVIKSDALWDAHCHSKRHRQILLALKQKRAQGGATSSSAPSSSSSTPPTAAGKKRALPQSGQPDRESVKRAKISEQEDRAKLVSASLSGGIPEAEQRDGGVVAEDVEGNVSSVGSVQKSGWAPVWDAAEKMYYYWNTQTGETTWERPTGVPECAPPSGEQPQLADQTQVAAEGGGSGGSEGMTATGSAPEVGGSGADGEALPAGFFDNDVGTTGEGAGDAGGVGNSGGNVVMRDASSMAVSEVRSSTVTQRWIHIST